MASCVEGGISSKPLFANPRKNSRVSTPSINAGKIATIGSKVIIQNWSSRKIAYFAPFGKRGQVIRYM